MLLIENHNRMQPTCKADELQIPCLCCKFTSQTKAILVMDPFKDRAKSTFPILLPMPKFQQTWSIEGDFLHCV